MQLTSDSIAKPSDYHWCTFFDITAANAVESVLSGSKVYDLWGKKVLGDFADMMIYGEQASFPLHVNSEEINNFTAKKVFEPNVFTEMQTINRFNSQGDFLVVVPYSPDDVKSINLDYMNKAFENFYGWATGPNIPDKVRAFSRYHHTPEMMARHAKNIKNRLMLDVKRNISSETLINFCREINLSESEALYCFDVVFRYGFYGDIAEKNAGDTKLNNHRLKPVG
jgi:hypothetical protein